MILCEEYFKRHRIDLPLVAYRKQSCVVVDHTGLPFSIQLITIQRGKEKNGPAAFKFSYFEPSSSLVFSAQKTEVVAWDEYEQHVFSLRSRTKPYIREAALLVAWEVIVRCFDRWFARKFSASDTLFDTIDSGNPKRLESIHRLLNSFDSPGICEETIIVSWWHHLSENYSDWFVKL